MHDGNVTNFLNVRHPTFMQAQEIDVFPQVRAGLVSSIDRAFGKDRALSWFIQVLLMSNCIQLLASTSAVEHVKRRLYSNWNWNAATKLFGDNHPKPWLPVSNFVDRKWGITVAFASPTSACSFDMSHLERTVGFSCSFQTYILLSSFFSHLQAQTTREKWAWPRGRKVGMTKPPAQWQKQIQHKWPPRPGSHAQPFEGPHLKWITCGIAGILCTW